MTKIKAIYFPNVLESFYRTYQSLPAKKRLFWTRYDVMEGNRALFYNDDDKVIITPFPINSQHFVRTLDLMGWKNVYNLTPTHPSSSICEDCMTDRRLRTQLIKLIKTTPGVALIPYRATPEFYRLMTHLKKKSVYFTTPETISPEQEFVNLYCHSKRGFRHLFSLSVLGNSNFKISIPEGFITANKEEALEAAWWLEQQKRSFVIKINKGTQGIGVSFNDYSKLPKKKKQFINHIRSLLTDRIWSEPLIVVEELIEADKTKLGGSPSVEFVINKNGKVTPTYGCEQVLAEDKKTFRGIYIHQEVMSDKHIKEAFKAGKRFGQELARLGYRGYFDIDLVISKEDKVYAVESNLRRTGGTHVHEAAVALLGKKYWQSFHVIGEDIILPENSHLTYKKCFFLLQEMAFNKKRKTGLIFCNPDMLTVNILNMIFIGQSKEKVNSLRQETKKRLKAIS